MTTPQNGTHNVRSATRSNATQGKEAPQYNTTYLPNSLATAGFTVAAILGGIVLVVLIYLWKRHKGKQIIRQNRKHFLCVYKNIFLDKSVCKNVFSAKFQSIVMSGEK